MKNITCMLIDPPTMMTNVSRTNIAEAMEALNCAPPIGLYYLAAYLRENGVGVSILDAKSLHISHEETYKEIEREEPDLVGVEVFTTQLRSARILCQEMRERFPEIRIVLGGPHIHSQYAEIIKEDWVDFCVRGEGEITLLELVQAISNGGGYEKVRGICFKKGGEVVITPERPQIPNLDILPFPARDLTPVEIYKEAMWLEEGNYTMASASRGCPYRCHYCEVPSFWPSRRYRSVDNILDELEQIAEDYDIRFVKYSDEIFCVHKKWLMEFCRKTMERGLQDVVKWACETTVNSITPEMLDAMKQAGCDSVFYGFEFGNQQILDDSNSKRQKIPVMHQAIDWTKQAGIKVYGNFMMGYPTETKEDVEMTIALARSTKLDHTSFSIVTPFPGTALYRECKEKGLLRSENFEEYSYFHPGKLAIQLTIPDDEFQGLYEKAHEEYYYRHIRERVQQEMAAIF